MTRYTKHGKTYHDKYAKYNAYYGLVCMIALINEDVGINPHFCPFMHADATCAAVMTDSQLGMLRLKGFGQIAP